MSSFKSFFKKTHKYETQADLKNMTAQQIVSLDPNDVSSRIDRETGGVPLTDVKKRAMFNLLAQKNLEKEIGPNPSSRSRAIDSFLKREGLRNDPEVSKLMIDTNNEVMNERLSQKQLENRLRKLNDQPEIPYTQEEQLFLRMKNLNTGGKTQIRRREKNKKSYKKRKTYKKGTSYKKRKTYKRR